MKAPFRAVDDRVYIKMRATGSLACASCILAGSCDPPGGVGRGCGAWGPHSCGFESAVRTRQGATLSRRHGCGRVPARACMLPSTDPGSGSGCRISEVTHADDLRTNPNPLLCFLRLLWFSGLGSGLDLRGYHLPETCT